MTVRVNQFTPERLIEAPRRSAGSPSPDGKLVLFTQSTYTFESHSKSSEICVLDRFTSQTTVLSKDASASEPNWTGNGYELLWLKSGDNGNTSIIVSNATTPGKQYSAGTISGPVSNLKLFAIKPGTIAIAVAGQANTDGSLYNPKDAPKSYTTARLYDSLFVRHWDAYATKQQNSIFTGVLHLLPVNADSQLERYNLTGVVNALKSTGLECPIPPFGGTDHFDIGPKGLVIVAKDPELDLSLHTKCNAYFIPRVDFTDLNVAAPQKIALEGFDGAATCPVFSPDGNTFVFLQMVQDGYETDQNKIILVPNIAGGGTQIAAQQVMATIEERPWDRSPASLVWSHDGRELYVVAENQGTGTLYALSLFDDAGPNPRQLTKRGYVSNVTLAAKGSDLLFVSSSNLTDSSVYTIIDPTFVQPDRVIFSASNFGANFGLSERQIVPYWWVGDKGRSIHAWIVVPSYFNPDFKYPVAFLIHGGPQGAWNDQWSTRWNPALFAEQGYVVVCPNPTGSTGYGQAFTDDIKNNWGGSPYTDIERGFEYVTDKLPWADTSRAVALGASYGGYMMNWIQGQPLAKKFKALVCHDGVFSVANELASDEQYFPIHDMGGTMWDKQEAWDKWDPARHAKNWSTPMLVIHNELDYRLPISEGLGAFNVLQIKGIESRFLTFSDENHWVLKHENSLVWHLVVLNWINKFVGLPKVVDRNGSDASEYVMQGKRGKQ